MAIREKAYLECVKKVSAMDEFSQEFLITAIESSYDGIYITDGNANTIMVNKSYEAISGLDRGKVLNRNMRDLVKEGVISKSGTLLALESGRAVTLEQSFQTGKRVLITSTPIFDWEDRIAMVLTNVRDITEIRHLEEKLASSNEQNQVYTNELESLREQVEGMGKLVAQSPAMQEVLRMAIRVAKLDAPVLISGEIGTGKRGLARHIVGKSGRKKARLISVNCSGNQEVVERKLFGCAQEIDPKYPEGNKGLLELADGGTLLLEEIGELSAGAQKKLYTFLRQQRFEPIGSLESVQADVRIIATTRYPLKELVEQRRFLEELYYQLNVLSIRIPPLRERREDILSIVRNIASAMNKKYHQRKKFSPLALEGMSCYDWPGNIWELKNVVERAMVMCPEDTISLRELAIQTDGLAVGEVEESGETIDLQRRLDQMEYRYLEQAYQKHGTVRAAARSLQMDPSTFVRRRKKLQQLLLLQK